MTPSIFRGPGESQEQAEERISKQLQAEADTAGLPPDPLGDDEGPEAAESEQ